MRVWGRKRNLSIRRTVYTWSTFANFFLKKNDSPDRSPTPLTLSSIFTQYVKRITYFHLEGDLYLPISPIKRFTHFITTNKSIACYIFVYPSFHGNDNGWMGQIQTSPVCRRLSLTKTKRTRIGPIPTAYAIATVIHHPQCPE